MPSTFDCYCGNVLVPIGVSCHLLSNILDCNEV